jgi:hypothetical protein
MPAKSPVFDVSTPGAAPGPGSDRTFGLFFAALFALLGGYALWTRHAWGWIAVAVAALLAVLAFTAPNALRPANRLWFALGMLLARIVNPIVIGIMFFAVITPIGLLMRVLGKRPLSLSFDRSAATYWTERKPRGPAPESMRDQF